MIQLRDIHKSFGGQTVLEGITFDIPDETRLCIVGGSGSGKSVLVKILLGLIEPEKGEIWVDGMERSAGSGKNFFEKVGVVFQESALFDSLTVLENVGIRLFEAGKHHDTEIKDAVVEALRQVALEPDIVSKYPAQLSGGMRKRVAIARAIIHKPTYLVYDEPTTGLDPISANIIDKLIVEQTNQKGKTGIVITHDLTTVKMVANLIAMIHDAGLCFIGTPSEFLSSSHPTIRNFLERDQNANYRT